MGILLDIDDTLINHTEAEQIAAYCFGETFSKEIPAYNRNNFNVLWIKTTKKYIEEYLQKKISFEEQRINRIRHIFDQPKMNREEAKEIFAVYLNLYEKEWNVFPDVIPFLNKYMERGISIGIITDGSQEQQEKKLERMGIRNYFEFILTAETEKKSKPEKELFLKGKKKLRNKANKTFYIGDNLEKDALGAEDAGLVGIWLNRNQDKNNKYKYTLTDLNDFDILFEKLNM